MALKTPLTYTKAWEASNNPGAALFPASVDVEADARENLEFQHDQAQAKINEIVDAIATALTSNDDEHIPTVKAIVDALVDVIYGVKVGHESLTPDANGVVDIVDVSKCSVTSKTDEEVPVATTRKLNEIFLFALKMKLQLEGLATVATTGAYSDLSGAPTVSGTSGKIAKFTGANAVGDAFSVTVSTSDPTGGDDGDFWFKVEA